MVLAGGQEAGGRGQGAAYRVLKTLEPGTGGLKASLSGIEKFSVWNRGQASAVFVPNDTVLDSKNQGEEVFPTLSLPTEEGTT